MSTAVTTALHASLATALGAFGLAVAATIHALGPGASTRTAPLAQYGLALLAWPVVTAGPAFVVALLAATTLGFARRRHGR